MLIEFTVGNYRSFREPVTLNMEATKISSQDKNIDVNNVISLNQSLRLLTSAAIYGANASGKSNLIDAIAFMRAFVINSARESQAEDPIGVIPFRLNTLTLQQPTYFEVIFMLDNQKYRYGFEVSRERIEREWLFRTPTIREAMLFQRDKDKIQYNSRSFREGRGLVEKTRPNALFLSVAAQFNGPIGQKVLKWFRRMVVISGIEDIVYRKYTVSQYLENTSSREQIRRLVRSLDVGIEDIIVEKVAPDKIKLPENMPDELKKLIISSSEEFISSQTKHIQYDENNQAVDMVEFDLESDESEGTKKLFFLSGPILQTLKNGNVLIVDEMEARMHPLITCALIRLFNSTETNPNHAQLIFITHDTNLLDRTLFRRDQIWFVEKDSYGASHLYSLVEFKPRNDESFERNYLRGKYGAIPYLGDLTWILNEDVSNPEEVADNGA